MLGLSSLFPKLAAAGTPPIEALRQLITSDPRTSRTIMWQSRVPLEDCQLQYRDSQGKLQHQPAIITSLQEDRVTNYYYTVYLKDLTPGTTYSYRIWQGNDVTSWQ